MPTGSTRFVHAVKRTTVPTSACAWHATRSRRTPTLSGSANPFTVFPGHGFHLGHIPEKGVGGVQITVPGDGQGNSLCAECHYNLHGNPASERGLVLFAPNVQPFNGRVSYDVANQSCTLTCHGREHDGLVFDEAETGT